MKVLALPIASTFIGHRKYFRFFAHFCGILDRIHFTQLCSLLKFRMYGSYYLAKKNANTCDAQRKYFQQPTQVLSLAIASTCIFHAEFILNFRLSGS